MVVLNEFAILELNRSHAVCLWSINILYVKKSCSYTSIPAVQLSSLVVTDLYHFCIKLLSYIKMLWKDFICAMVYLSLHSPCILTIFDNFLTFLGLVYILLCLMLIFAILSVMSINYQDIYLDTVYSSIIKKRKILQDANKL